MAVGKGIGAHFAAAATRFGIAFTLTILLASPATKQSLSASLQPIEDFGPNRGQLNMYVYIPDGHEPNSTMVVALHGCEQEATDFDDETGLIALADALKFVLLFPSSARQTMTAGASTGTSGKTTRKIGARPAPYGT